LRKELAKINLRINIKVPKAHLQLEQINSKMQFNSAANEPFIPNATNSNKKIALYKLIIPLKQTYL
jgi:hypothetical protein